MQTTKQIKAGWNPGERDTAHCHLYNYGVIFLDGLGSRSGISSKLKKCTGSMPRQAE